MRSCLAVLVGVPLLLHMPAGCAAQNPDAEFEGLGKTGASSQPGPGLFAPVQDGNLDALQQRGRLLHDMERSLRMAYERGALKVGIGEGAVVLPLVDVDPGGHSAQVVFVRWSREAAAGGTLRAQDAQRWLMVSVLLAPDRVLDVELLTGPVAEASSELRRVEELLVAAGHLRTLTPEESYHLFTLTERLTTKNEAGTTRQTRVYAMSADGDGPDLELVLVRNKKKKKKPPRLLTAVRLHPGPAATANPIEVAAPYPGAPTVARALLRGPEAGELDANAQMGTFRISSRDGRVERVGGPPEPAEPGGPASASPAEPAPSGGEPPAVAPREPEAIPF